MASVNDFIAFDANHTRFGSRIELYGVSAVIMRVISLCNEDEIEE